MRIGILGGTFNPVHLAHLILAECALKALKLDKVFFVPANIQALKVRAKLASGPERLNMLKLAIRGKEKFAVSDVEISRGGKSYTIDTLRFYRKKFKQRLQLFFIAGSDSLKDLNKWKDLGKILKLAKFVVAKRPEFSLGELSKKITYINMPEIDISSSDIRKRIKAGKSIKYLVDGEVLEYIKKKKLYR